MTHEYEPPEVTIESLRRELEQSREVAREEAQRAEARRAELRTEWETRWATQRDRYNAEITSKQERIDEILATDQGKAYADIEDMKRQVTRAEERATRAEGRAQQAESDKARALASVEGGPNIHPHDPRVQHIWIEAARIATRHQFCSEFDKIAEALGLPEIEMDYSGTAGVSITAYVNIPISGTATRRQIADGEVDPEIDTDAILENLDRGSISWDIDEIEVEPDE